MLRKSGDSPSCTCNRSHAFIPWVERKITPFGPEAHTTEPAVSVPPREGARLTPRRFVSIPDVCTTQTGGTSAAKTNRRTVTKINLMERILPTFVVILREA